MSKKSHLPVVSAAPNADAASRTGAKGPRKATRGQTLAHALDVAHTYVGDETPLDEAFAAFSDFDGDKGEADAQAIARAQALVRALLQPGAHRAAAGLVKTKKP